MKKGISAFELRMGNRIYLFQQESYVIPSDFKDVNDPEKEHVYTPIPLTEEWLIRFGFEKLPHSFSCDRFHITKQDNSDFWFTAFNKNNAFINKLKYVHQLQNLYFAITNEELKIKEYAYQGIENIGN